MTKGFNIFVDHYHKFFLDGISDANWWNTIVNGTYISWTPQEGDIRSHIHWLIHRLITFTINQRKEGVKVPSLDVFYLWSITTLGVFFNLPHYVVELLTSRAGKDSKGSPLGGGILITKFSRSYDVFEPREASFLIIENTRPFNRVLIRGHK